MREETKARLDQILEGYERKRIDFLRQHELTRLERQEFLDAFNRKIRGTIRPCLEELGNLIKLRGHGFEITQKTERCDPNGNTESACIKMEILPDGVRAQAGERPSISFVADSIRKEIWTQVSTIMSGCAGQRSVFSLDEIDETVVEEEVLSVLGSCFG